ncbi:MAG: shikimate dehydrogenase, partial [Mycobacteriales bacterium]
LDDSWVGLSLTMPLKTAVLPLLASSSDLVRATGSANTVLLPARHGENTDVAGMLAALAEVGLTQAARVVVLGSGATARSALAAAAALGCARPTVVARSTPAVPLDAEVVAWSPEVLDGCDLLISTLPARAADAFAAHVGDVPALLDVVYDPWPTALAQACRGVVASGAAMLLHQAAAQVTLMTGQAAPVDAMRGALKPAR